jgi:hypothetical protein
MPWSRERDAGSFPLGSSERRVVSPGRCHNEREKEGRKEGEEGNPASTNQRPWIYRILSFAFCLCVLTYVHLFRGMR